MTEEDKNAIRGALLFLREYEPIHADIDDRLDTWTSMETEAERKANIDLIEGAAQALDDLALKFITWHLMITRIAKTA